MNTIWRSESAIYYICGYSCDNAILIEIGKERFFLTDGRYKVEAEVKVKEAEVIICNNLLKKTVEILKAAKVKKIRIDPKEWDIYSFKILKDNIPCRWLFKPDLSHRKRIIKTEEEIEYLSKAARLGAEAFDTIAGKLWKDGKGEFNLCGSPGQSRPEKLPFPGGLPPPFRRGSVSHGSTHRQG